MPRSAFAAAAVYLLVAVWAFRVVVPSPATTLPVPAWSVPFEIGITTSDQDIVAFQIARNAHNFVASPGSLFEAGQCFPMARAVTMGEHMLGEGLLGAPVWAASGDPILTLNAVVLLTYWISAMAAYALVLHWTGSAEGAFAAGLLYGFHPVRLEDPVHPFIIGNQWTVLALLFADRLFRRRRFTDAAGLGLCLSLQLLESFYTVLGMVLIGGVYGLHLAWAHRRTLVATLPWIGAALIPPAITAALVYMPYLATRAEWGVLQDRGALLFFPQAYGFGGGAYPGTVVLVLAAVALVDRLLRRGALGEASDPRLALALAGFGVVWVSVYFLPLPFTGVSLPSLWEMARHVVPGMDAVRSGASLCVGLYLTGGLLAGYGVAVLCRGRSRGVRTAIVSLVAMVWSIETFAQAVSSRSFGRRTDVVGRDAAPSAETRRLYERIDDGAVADLPLAADSIAGYLSQASRYVRPHAYHRRPVGACNSSFLSAVQMDVTGALRRLPRAAAVLDGLRGLGFRYLLVHMDEVPQEQRVEYSARLQRLETPREGHAHLAAADTDGVRTLYRIEGSLEVTADPAQLEFLAEGAKLALAAPAPVLWLQVRNQSAEAVFVQAHPRLTPFLIRWYDAGGALRGESVVRALLPLAVAAGDRQWLSFPLQATAAAPGLETTIAYADRPDEILLRVRPQREGPG